MRGHSPNHMDTAFKHDIKGTLALVMMNQGSLHLQSLVRFGARSGDAHDLHTCITQQTRR